MSIDKPELTAIQWAVLYHKLHVANMKMATKSDYALRSLVAPSFTITASATDTHVCNYTTLAAATVAIKNKWGDDDNPFPAIIAIEWMLTRDGNILGFVRRLGDKVFSVIDRADGVSLRTLTSASEAIDWAIEHWTIRSAAADPAEKAETANPDEEEFGHLTFATVLWSVTVDNTHIAWIHKTDLNDYVIQRAAGSWIYRSEFGCETKHHRLRENTLKRAYELAAHAFYAATHEGSRNLRNNANVSICPHKWIVYDYTCDIGTIEQTGEDEFEVFDYADSRGRVALTKVPRLSDAKEFCVGYWEPDDESATEMFPPEIVAAINATAKAVKDAVREACPSCRRRRLETLKQRFREAEEEVYGDDDEESTEFDVSEGVPDIKRLIPYNIWHAVNCGYRTVYAKIILRSNGTQAVITPDRTMSLNAFRAMFPGATWEAVPASIADQVETRTLPVPHLVGPPTGEPVALIKVSNDRWYSFIVKEGNQHYRFDCKIVDSLAPFATPAEVVFSNGKVTPLEMFTRNYPTGKWYPLPVEKHQDLELQLKTE